MSQSLQRQTFLLELLSERASLEKAPFMRTNYIGREQHFSTTPLSELKPIRLREMRKNMPYTEHYLLCRIIALPYSMGYIRIGIEDQDGWVHTVDLHNFPYTDKMTNFELETLFPLDTIVAIREPYPQRAHIARKSHIPVYSPSDFILLEPNNPIVSRISWNTGNRPFPQATRTREQWKVLGNQHFKSKAYFASLIAYTLGLNYHLTLGDCKDVLSVPNLDKESKLKALYRSAQAAYGLGDYTAAIEWYSKCTAEDTSFKDAELGIDKCNKRIKEMETGEYDWVHMWKHGLVPGYQLDVAEYRGPIKVVPMENRGGGRGIVASRDIKIGELLLVSKAFAVSHRAEYPTGHTFRNINFNTDEEILELQYQAMQKAISKIYANSILATQFFDLYAGEGFSKPESIESNFANIKPHDNPLAFAFNVDINQMEKILNFNTNPLSFDPKASKEILPTALFTSSAYLNHSCVPNTYCNVYANVLVLHATEDIPEGKEITKEYTYSPQYSKRQVALQKYRFQCDCPLCKADRADGREQNLRRDRLIQEAEQKEWGLTALEARTLVEEMNKTYTQSRTTVSPGLAFAYSRLITTGTMMATDPCNYEAIIKNFEASGVTFIDKSLKEASRYSSDLPFSPTIVPHVPMQASIFCNLNAMFFMVTGKPRKARMWVQAAVWIEDTACGGGIKSYRARNWERLHPIISCMLDEIETMGSWGILPID